MMNVWYVLLKCMLLSVHRFYFGKAIVMHVERTLHLLKCSTAYYSVSILNLQILVRFYAHHAYVCFFKIHFVIKSYTTFFF